MAGGRHSSFYQRRSKVRIGGHLNPLVRRLDPGRKIERQPYRKASALAFPALDLDAATMQIDHHLHEVEPNARPDDARNIAAAMIALEQTIKILRGNADAVVLDGNHHVVGLDSSIDLDRPGGRGIFDGIGQEVAEGLIQ